MVKKRQQPAEARQQLSFDFAFNETLETIDRLTTEIDHDDDLGAQDANRTTATSHNRSNSSETDNPGGNSAFALVPPSGLEDSRSLGVQRSSEAAEPGGPGRSDLVGPAANTTGDRANGPTTRDIVHEGTNGTRDSGQSRDQHRALSASDYTISNTDRLGEGGAKSKYRDNIQALTLLNLLRREGRAATAADQAVLVRYVGWGGLPQVFDHRNSDWENEYRELSTLLPKDQYDRARRSTQDAHYTSQTVIQGIYKGLDRLGFNGGRVLEPSAGTGNFIGLMPATMRSASNITAIELDPLTAEIASHLYPTSTVINRGLQDVVIPTGHFDAVVGNPPFGNQTLYDPQHRELGGFSIHNYFLAKSLDKLREGGIMAVVVSRYFMDAVNPSVREYLAHRAHLLGAIRLPNNAFKQNALTEVTTDIIFLKKAAEGETTDRSWVNVGEIRDYETGEPITLNQYYIDNPEQMAGRMAITSRMHRDTADLLPDPRIDLASAIEQRIAALPSKIYAPAATLITTRSNYDENKPQLTLPDTLKIGSFFVAPNGRLARRLPDLLDQHDYNYVELKNERTGSRIKALINVRAALRDLMQAEQLTSSTDIELENKRDILNRVYDQFIQKYGHISSQSNRLAMSEDPEYPLLHALESDYDKGISRDTAKKHGVDPRAPTAKKAAIFSTRVISPRKEISHVDTAKEALVVSMNESGKIDLSRMTSLTGKPEHELIRDLKSLIYLNPENNQWETADQYLTGNVKSKLRAAERAAQGNPRYIENVDALRAVQPADIEPIDISVQLGSTWVPDKITSEFIGHLLGDVRRHVTYQEALGKWIVDIKPGDRTTDRVTWGTDAYPANELIRAILTNRPIQVRVEVGKDEHGNKILRIDDAQTAAANQKADEIRQAFVDWVWEDKERRETLAALYNERFNTNIPGKYDGSHLELPNASLDISLRPHQKDAIWRGIQDGTALFDHRVGAGKTLVCVGTIMESRRMGLMSKPMLVVPNHLLLQWKDAFYSLYPSANILVAEKSDFKKENRERLFGRIATGDWDAVIVAHSSFKKIGMPEHTLQELLEEQINDLSDAITQLKAEQGDRVTIKEMEKARERMTARLQSKADTGSKDQAVSFSDLGVDALFVDEAQEFKNLYITTTLSRISGLGNLSGSEKAFDLFVKCRYLQQKHDGRGVFFATGTPVSNTIAELYTMQRYLQYDTLKARGIVHFDAWASTFGQVVTGWELDATGVNYRLNSRFSKFQNVPELITLYRTFADVITQSDLEKQAQERGTRFPVPKIKGGRPQNIIVERSEAQALFMGVQSPMLTATGEPVVRSDGLAMKTWNKGSIIDRMENLPRDPRIDNPLKITNDARKAGLDFRLIDPDAPDEPGSKINRAITEIYRIWKDTQENKGTQLVFCDLSTPKPGNKSDPTIVEEKNQQEDTDEELPVISMDEMLANSSRFSVYDDIKKKLISRGVPEQEIRFIHEASTDLQKAKLFDEMNRGQARILLGSTAKMGAGTNVQRRLVAEHHLDAPWRPSDLEQREGRILRQGNLFYEMDPDNFEVEILRYATKQTYDSRMWQTIEYKATGIEQFRKGDSLQRVIEDVASEAANAAEMKAAATGNPLIFLQVQLSAELKKAEALFSNYRRNKHSLESRIGWLMDADKRADRTIARWNKEIDIRDSSDREFRTTSRSYGENDREALLRHIMSSMKKAIEEKSNKSTDKTVLIPVGSYRGFKVEVHAGRDQIQFAVTGHDSYEPENLRYYADDKFSINGFINRVDNFLGRFEAWRQAAEEARVKERAEYTKALAEQAKPFAQQERLDALRNDVRDVMTELKLMQADDNYVSTWQPRSLDNNKTKVGAGPGLELRAPRPAAGRTA